MRVFLGRDDAQADGSGAAAGAGVAAPRGAGRGGEADVWVVCGGVSGEKRMMDVNHRAYERFIGRFEGVARG